MYMHGCGKHGCASAAPPPRIKPSAGSYHIWQLAQSTCEGAQGVHGERVLLWGGVRVVQGSKRGAAYHVARELAEP